MFWNAIVVVVVGCFLSLRDAHHPHAVILVDSALKFAQHIIETGHKYDTTEKTMKILHIVMCHSD
jgi:hypothetical protein